MRDLAALPILVRCVLPSLLCAVALTACEPGNDLKRFSGRHLHGGLNSSQGDFIALLDRKLPEAGCLQLHPDVVATFDGVPLTVFPGSPIVDPDRCNDPEQPPSFLGKLDTDLFFGEPRNAVMEIQDGDERITAEFTNFFGRHTFALVDPPPAVKPGEEIFLQWDPPTDDLSKLDAVRVGGTEVPARPEAGGMRFTVPANFPTGRMNVVHSGQMLIPAERCEGVALCTANAWPIYRPAQLDIQP